MNAERQAQLYRDEMGLEALYRQTTSRRQRKIGIRRCKCAMRYTQPDTPSKFHKHTCPMFLP